MQDRMEMTMKKIKYNKVGDYEFPDVYKRQV